MSDNALFAAYMDATTSSDSIVGLRARAQELRRLPGGTLDALRLLCFLRLVEDNAEALGATPPKEPLDDVMRAYGTSFFPSDRLAGYVAEPAVSLGMDADALGAWAGSMEPDAVRSAIGAFGLGAGSLAGYSFEKPRLFGVWNSLEKGVLWVASGRMMWRKIMPALAPSALSSLAHRPGRLVMCDPWCSDGLMTACAWRDVARAMPGLDVEMWACCGGPTDVVDASLSLLFAGYRGEFSHVRTGSSADVFEASRMPDLVESLSAGAGGDDALGAIARFVERMPEGCAAVLSCERLPISGPASADDRRALVASGRLDAVIERYSSASVERPVLVFSPQRSTAGGVYLACGGADGVKRPLADGRPPDLMKALETREARPFLAETIPANQILASHDCSLRYSSYRDTVDVMGRLSALPSVDELRARRERLLDELSSLEGELT